MEVNFPNLTMPVELVEAGEELVVTESKEESQPALLRTGEERLAARKVPVEQDTAESPVSMPQSVRTDELLGSGRLLLPPGLQKQLQSSDLPPQHPVSTNPVSVDEGGLRSDRPVFIPREGTPKNDLPDRGHGSGGDISLGTDPGTGIGGRIDLPKDAPLPIELPPPVLQPPSDRGGHQTPPPVVVGRDPIPVDTTLPSPPSPTVPHPKEQPVSVAPKDGREQELPIPGQLPRDPVRPTESPLQISVRGEPGSKPPIEPPVRNASEVVTSTSRFHTVPVGQSLEQVAEEFSIDIPSLLEANPHLLKDPLLFAGQRLRVPSNLQPQPEKTHFGTPRVDEQLYAAVKLPTEQVVKFPSQSLRAEIEPMKSEAVQFEEQIQIEKTASETLLEEPATHSTGSLRRPQPARTELTDDPPIKLHEKENRQERVTEQKTVKQQENLTPGLGAHTTVRREENEEAAHSRKRKLNVSIPAPFDEWADFIYDAAEKYRLEPALLAAVIWCESGGKNVIGKDGYGFGLMQIDSRQHSAWLRQNDGLDPELNIDFGASLLRKYADYFGGRISHALAAFDCGLDAVEEALVLGKPVDYFTREGNYSLNVLTQMEYFKKFF